MRGPTLCGIGYALLFEEDAAGALEIFRAAVESDPGFPLGYPGLLAAASRAGEAADAEQARARLDSAGSLRFIELVRAPGHRAALQQLMAKTSGT